MAVFWVCSLVDVCRVPEVLGNSAIREMSVVLMMEAESTSETTINFY
jgi:hypothetical protein